jgi:hypothetical protein
LGIPVASKEITQRHRFFFSHTGAGLRIRVCEVEDGKNEKIIWNAIIVVLGADNGCKDV